MLNVNTGKGSKVSTNKYYSAPVSTKENGLVTKFKFQDRKDKVKENKKLKVTNKKKISSHSSHKDKSSKVSANVSEDEESILQRKNIKCDDSETFKEVSFSVYNKL